MSLYGDEHIKAMQKGECDDKIFLRSSRNNKRKPAVCTQRPGTGDLLKGQAPYVPPGRALAQQIQPQPCSSATSGPSLLPCFQAGEGKKKTQTRYLKLNAFSSKLFISSWLGSWAKHERRCAEIVFPKDTFRSRQSTLGTLALLWKPVTSTWAIRKLAKLTGTCWKLHRHVWVTLGKYSALPQLLYAPRAQLSPGDLHQPKVWHPLINSPSAAGGSPAATLGGGSRSHTLYTTGLLGPFHCRWQEAPLQSTEMCLLPQIQYLTFLAFLSFSILTLQPSIAWEHALNIKDVNGFLEF